LTPKDEFENMDHSSLVAACLGLLEENRILSEMLEQIQQANDWGTVSFGGTN